MGLFDFMSGAGENDVTAQVDVAPERVNELRRKNINENIANLAIDGEQVVVSVDGEVATLTGSAPDQESMEKMVLCAGNQNGIGRVDCRLEVEATPVTATSEPTSQVQAQQAQSTFYTVKSGDTLGKIAKDLYGDAGKYPVIFEANKPMLSDPDKIYPGQSLRIPPL